MLYKEDLLRRQDSAVSAAYGAGRFISSRDFSKIQISSKGLNDSVSDTDVATEKFISEYLRTRYPGDGFFGEEQGETGKNSGGRWIVDPIDGTDNYIRRNPNYTVSIAYEDSTGRLSLGVVYNPSQNEMFTAVAGDGAYLNGVPIEVSDIKIPGDAISVIAPPRKSYERTSDYFRLMEDIFLKTRDVRRFGSAAQELCYIACGRVDAFYEMGLHYYDIAAGMMILKEAGGMYSAFSDSETLIEDGNILATNGILHEWYAEKIHKNLER